MLNYILIFTVLLLLLILFYKLYMLSKDFKENDKTPKSILKKINKKEKEKDLTPTIEKFIPSKIYNGSKKGYYFGTSKEGTGYYLDKN